jgi:hypothetical protein
MKDSVDLEGAADGSMDLAAVLLLVRPEVPKLSHVLHLCLRQTSSTRDYLSWDVGATAVVLCLP